MQKYYSLLWLCLHGLTLHGQNLVANPGFENFEVCPGGYNTDLYMFRVSDWHSPSNGTPDHYHSCSHGEADVPHNWAGTTFPFEGEGYAGIFLWMSAPDYREYLQCKLKEPLIKDSVYQVSFRYKLSSYSQYAIDRVGVLISDSAIHHADDKPWHERATFESVKDTAFDRASGEWELFEFAYRAQGGEQYLTIGNFTPTENTRYYHFKFRPVQQEMLRYSAYYYIDDVRLLPTWTASHLLADFMLSKAELEKTYVLSNIQFEFNSYKLMQSSFYQLDDVVKYLTENPDIRIRLDGHTDDVGSDGYNNTLSRQRAGSVAIYLRSQGVDEKRIITRGYGKQKPLVNDTTEEARKVNRRVEVTFTR